MFGWGRLGAGGIYEGGEEFCSVFPEAFGFEHPFRVVLDTDDEGFVGVLYRFYDSVCCVCGDLEAGADLFECLMVCGVDFIGGFADDPVEVCVGADVECVLCVCFGGFVGERLGVEVL